MIELGKSQNIKRKTIEQTENNVRETKEVPEVKVLENTKSKRKAIMVETKVGEKKKKAISKHNEVYNIESLVEKKGSKYFVKWENYPANQNTWEPRSAVPPFILKVKKDSIILLLLLKCLLFC